MNRTLRVITLLGMLLVVSPDLSAGGFSIPDIGTRRTGMFAVMGKPDDVSAIFHNPAGMTLLEGTHFYYFQLVFLIDLGMRLYDSNGLLHPQDYELEPTYNFGALPFLGIQTDWGTKRLRTGVALYVPNAIGSLLPDDEPTRYHATQVLFLASRATGAVAWELNRYFSVGASLHLLFTYMTAGRIMNPQVLANPDRRFDPVEVTGPFDSELKLEGKGFSWAWDVGVLFRPLDSFRLGMSFASGAMTTLRGNVRLYSPDGALAATSRQTTDVPLPFTLRAGFNWELAPDFEVGMDVFYWHYQVFQEQHSRLDQPIMGMNEFRDPKNYGNSWSWCIGILHRVVPTLELMVGFHKDFTPIPAQTYSLDNPTTDQLGVALGARWQVKPRLRLGFSVYRNWFNLIDVQESQSVPPSNVKGHAAVTSLGFDVDWLL